jgi:NAD(P)H-dependent FMN reductase
MSDVIIISGSNNKNLELSKEFKQALEVNNIQSEVVNLVSLDIPLYTPPEELKGIPELVFEYVEKFDKAKGFVFVIPEYNGGVPPVVTSLIAWISRSGNQDWRACFNGKPAAIASFSGSGGFQALISLRTQLSYIGLNVIGRQVRATYKEEVKESDIEAVTKLLSKGLGNA